MSFPIYWNTKKFSKRDLIELVSAIEAAEALVDVNGKPLSFTKLIDHFSNTFNFPINPKAAYNDRMYMLNVRQNTADFIQKLSRALDKKQSK